MHNRIFNFFSILVVVLVGMGIGFSGKACAQTNDNHLMLSTGLMYENGLNFTAAYEHGSKYHNAWEYFATYYVKYAKDPVAGHYTKKSFWDNYSTWHLGIAYKPCVTRGRNHHGNVRLGVSGGSNGDVFVAGVHVGYEHTYTLYNGWEVFARVKEDAAFPRKKDNIFRTGVDIGVKVPL